MQKQNPVLLTLTACALAACADDTTVITLTPIENWIAAPEYEFGDQMEGDALFGRIRDVRPTADGSTIYVLDAQSAEVTMWTPDGTLVGRAGGHGEGPGEFSNPGPLFLHDDRFQVGDNAQYRYTTFTLEGEVVRTDGFPPGVGPLEPGMDLATYRRVFTRFQAFAMFDDGSVGALGLPHGGCRTARCRRRMPQPSRCFGPRRTAATGDSTRWVC